MYKRTINLDSYLKHKSIILLGPRQTGKSTLLRYRYPQAQFIDLLETDTFRGLSRSPESLRQIIGPDTQLVIIDEVQRLPNILNEVQLLIDRNKKLRFILTGSSARKLNRGHANLLGGRALFFNLFPLTSEELGFDRIEDQICRGSLPSIIDSEIHTEELRAYIGTYLREEIQAEGLTRSIENFSRFLDFCSYFNGQQINYTKIGNDAQVAPRTIQDYVSILRDTLVVDLVPPVRPSSGRKTVAIEKLYFFDVGIANSLMGRTKVVAGSRDFGDSLEHFVFLELKAYIEYHRKNLKISFWRTQTKLEVDFVIDNKIAIEVKGTGRVTQADLKGLVSIQDDLNLEARMIVCNESKVRHLDHGITVYPIRDFCQLLWKGNIF